MVSKGTRNSRIAILVDYWAILKTGIRVLIIVTSTIATIATNLATA
jgi:hypothetical protein